MGSTLENIEEIIHQVTSTEGKFGPLATVDEVLNGKEISVKPSISDLLSKEGIHSLGDGGGSSNVALRMLVARLFDPCEQLRVLAASSSESKASLEEIHAALESINTNIQTVLRSAGVVRIEGQAKCPYDAAIHRRAQLVSDPSLPPNTVVETISPGYSFKASVMRRAAVKVANCSEGSLEEVPDDAELQISNKSSFFKTAGEKAETAVQKAAAVFTPFFKTFEHQLLYRGSDSKKGTAADNNNSNVEPIANFASATTTALPTPTSITNNNSNNSSSNNNNNNNVQETETQLERTPSASSTTSTGNNNNTTTTINPSDDAHVTTPSNSRSLEARAKAQEAAVATKALIGNLFSTARVVSTTTVLPVEDLCEQLNSGVSNLLQHMNITPPPAADGDICDFEWKTLQLVRMQVCPVLLKFLHHGFRPSKFVGPKTFWAFVEAGMIQASSHDVTSLCFQEAIRSVNDNKHIKESADAKFKSLVCICLNKQVLHVLFLKLGSADKEKDRKSCYDANALIQSNEECAKIVNILQPLSSIKFNLPSDLGVSYKDEDTVILLTKNPHAKPHE